MRKTNLVGKRFGKLVVIREAPKELQTKRSIVWECLCDCGKTYYGTTSFLNSGRVKSCGCYREEFRKLSGKNAAKNRLYLSYKRTAERKGLFFDIPEDLFFLLVSSSCHYCGIEPQNVMRPSHYDSRDPERWLNYNGLDRIDPSKNYTPDNVVPCCSTCNYAKRIMSQEQFLSWIKRVYIHQYRKVTDNTPGQLIDLLFTTDYKCWWAQERLLDQSLSAEQRAEEARKAQEYNAKRTKLIRTIDQVLDFSENTNTEKTYDKDEKTNYTYFENKKEG